MDGMPPGLVPGERVLWAGRPVWRSLVHPNYVIIIPVRAGFAALVSLLGTVMVTGALSHFTRTGVDPFDIAGWVFGLTVAYQLVSHVVRAVVLSRTRYVLTDRRVLVVTGRTTAADLGSLGYPALKEGRDGFGRITFAASWLPGRRGSTPVMRQLADARRVWALLVGAQRAVLPAVVGPPEAPAVAARAPRAPVRGGSPVRRLAVAVALFSIAPVGLGTAMVGQFGLVVTRATATSCTGDLLPHTKNSYVYDCDVTWKEHGARRSGTYHADGISIPAAGTKIPVWVHGDMVSRGDLFWAAEGILVQVLVALVVVFVVVARRVRLRSP
jgi:hypothetical protein